MSESIRPLPQQVAKGGFWVFALRVIQKVFSLTRLIILARILSPNDFGLMGIALLTIATLETFSQTGFQQALIQRKEDTKTYLNSAWTVNIIRGFILFAILNLIAPYTAVYFEAQEAKSVIQVMGLSILFQSFSNIGIIYFQKELKFNKQFIYQSSGILADFIVAVSAAFLLKSVWALVFGILAGNFMKFITSYLIHPFRPHFSLDFKKIRELFGFGKWIFSSSILVFLLTQGDDIFVGKLLGATALGFYQMAYRISNMPATEMSHVISTVMLPAYSKLQDKLSTLRDAYLKVLQLTTLISIPLAGGIFIIAPEFTEIFLGGKWISMVPAMQILALYGSLRAIGATTGVVFLAVGKPEISTKIKFAQLILMAILIYPFTIRWGIAGAAISVTAYALIFNFVAVYKVLNLIKADYKKAIKIIILPLINTLIVIFSIFIIKTYIFKIADFISFFLFTVGFVITYLFIVYLFDLFLDYRSKNLIQEQFIYFSQNSEKR